MNFIPKDAQLNLRGGFGGPYGYLRKVLLELLATKRDFDPNGSDGRARVNNSKYFYHCLVGPFKT